jgi:hypothetical protein
MIRKTLLILTAALGLITSAQAGGYTHHLHTNYLGGTDCYWDDAGNRMIVYPDGSRLYTYFNPKTGDFAVRGGNTVFMGNALKGTFFSN